MADDLQSRSEQWQIRVRDLRKSFGTQHVLRGVNLDIERRKINIIIGGSGQGKSVLMKHLMGLLVAMLYDGIIVASGTRDEVLAAPPLVLREFVEPSGAVHFGGGPSS
jgi:ABC-type sugar transport system ATPase subunit